MTFNVPLTSYNKRCRLQHEENKKISRSGGDVNEYV